MDPSSRLASRDVFLVTKMSGPHNTLRRDFRIFLEPGFLITLLLVGALAGIVMVLLVGAAEKYGIPLSGYWR